MRDPEDQLGPRLENAFNQLRQVAPRPWAGATKGRARFLAEAAESPRRAGFFNLLPRPSSFAMTAAIVLLVLMVGGTGATAYAAEGSLPNTPLYAIKLFTEDARVTLTLQPDSKLDLILAFADRRLGEIATMGDENVAVPETVASRLEQELDQALRIAMELPDAKRLQALERMQSRIQRQTQKASEVKVQPANKGQDVVDRVRDTLQEQLDLVEIGKADPPGLKKKLQEPPQSGDSRVAPGEQDKHSVTPPGQGRKSTPEQQNPNDDKGNGKGNGNGNSKH